MHLRDKKCRMENAQIAKHLKLSHDNLLLVRLFAPFEGFWSYCWCYCSFWSCCGRWSGWDWCSYSCGLDLRHAASLLVSDSVSPSSSTSKCNVFSISAVSDRAQCRGWCKDEVKLDNDAIWRQKNKSTECAKAPPKEREDQPITCFSLILIVVWFFKPSTKGKCK